MHADDAALVADQALDRGLAQQHDAVLAGKLSEITVKNRPQNGVAGAEHLRVAQCRAQHRVAVVGVEATLDERALNGTVFDRLAAEGLRCLDVLGKVDGAGPVLGSRIHRGLADEYREPGAAECGCSGDTGRATAYNDDVKAVLLQNGELQPL